MRISFHINLILISATSPPPPPLTSDSHHHYLHLSTWIRKYSIPSLVNKLRNILKIIAETPPWLSQSKSQQNQQFTKPSSSKLSLIKSYIRAHIKECPTAVWNLKRDNNITNYGDNVLRAQFPAKLDTNNVLKNGPWLFEGNLVAMERCSPKFHRRATSLNLASS